jgi:hypothetical protein
MINSPLSERRHLEFLSNSMSPTVTYNDSESPVRSRLGSDKNRRPQSSQTQEAQKEVKSFVTLKVLDVPMALIPITFCDIPLLVHEVWQYMRFVNTADFQRLDTKENYEVFLRCVLVLCQAKLAYAHKHRLSFKAQLDKLMDGKRTESALAQMAATLPVPIAILLDSIGVTKFLGQDVVPVIATLKSNEELSGAINFLPAHINMFITELKKGVVKGGLAHTLADRLHVFTDVEWEDAHPAEFGSTSTVQSNQAAMVKLSEKSYKALHYPDEWVTDDQISLFKAVCSTLKLVRKSNIRSGQGQENQLVQLVNRKVCDTVEFYVMQNISISDLNFAFAFGFGHHDHELKQTSRYLGSPENALMRGTCNPNKTRKLLCSEHYMQLRHCNKRIFLFHVLTAYVPITFHNIPAFVHKVWKKMSCIGGKRFQRKENYEIFLKCVLGMCQAKLVCAHRAMPSANPTCSDLMNESALSIITSAASSLPGPIAVLLDCIGIASVSHQDVVPVIAKLKIKPELSGAINFFPADINVLIDKLRNGVVKGGLEHTFGKNLQVLTKVEWETLYSVNSSPQTKLVRLTNKSYKSLYFHDNSVTFNEMKMFKKICNSFSPEMHTCDIRLGHGRQCQLVQFTEWKPSSTVEFYVMQKIADDELKIAAAFGFGHHKYEIQSASKFRGSPETAYKTGECSQSEASDFLVSLLSVHV